MLDNFKRVTVFRIIALFGALLMIIGVFPTFLYIEDTMSCNLFKALPVGAIIIIITALAIIIGIGIANKIVSIIGAAIGFLADISFTFIMKSTSYIYKMSGLGELGENIEDGMESMFGNAYGDAIKEELKSLVSFKAGFYIILIGAIISLIAMVIDLVKADKNIEDKVLGTASAISGAASSVMANTANEYSESIDLFAPRTRHSGKASLWTCNACGNENQGTSQFCVFCGQEKPKPRVCYQCGTMLEDHMAFCPKCGTEFDREKSDKRYEEDMKQLQKSLCKYCGARLPEGASFCGKCGKQQ